MKYLSWNEKTITDFFPAFVGEMYEKGYVFTRLGRGVMQQTRSLRIDLSKFELSSENKRILKKVPDLEIETVELPLESSTPLELPPKSPLIYDYSIGKMAKDFYEAKFGPGIMSAQKVKEMLTDANKSNFNLLLKFKLMGSLESNEAVAIANVQAVESVSKMTSLPRRGGVVPSEKSTPPPGGGGGPSFGFTICFTTDTCPTTPAAAKTNSVTKTSPATITTPSFLHYSYPFYDLKTAPKDMGLAMMISAIQFAKESGLKYIYLGSLQRSSDTYKLQFKGIEWFDGDSKTWSNDIEEVKGILNKIDQIK